MPFYQDKHRGLRLALRIKRNERRNATRRPLHWPQVNAKERFTNRITTTARRHYHRTVLQRRNDMARYLRQIDRSQASRFRRYRLYKPAILAHRKAREWVRNNKPWRPDAQDMATRVAEWFGRITGHVQRVAEAGQQATQAFTSLTEAIMRHHG